VAAAAHVKRLERRQTTDASRNRDQAVAVQLESKGVSNASATSATHGQQRQLRHGKHAGRHLGEGVAVQLTNASKQRHENKKGAHVELGHARQLRDVVGHGDEMSTPQLRRMGDT